MESASVSSGFSFTNFQMWSILAETLTSSVDPLSLACSALRILVYSSCNQNLGLASREAPQKWFIEVQEHTLWICHPHSKAAFPISLQTIVWSKTCIVSGLVKKLELGTLHFGYGQCTQEYRFSSCSWLNTISFDFEGILLQLVPCTHGFDEIVV